MIPVVCGCSVRLADFRIGDGWLRVGRKVVCPLMGVNPVRNVCKGRLLRGVDESSDSDGIDGTAYDEDDEGPLGGVEDPIDSARRESGKRASTVACPKSDSSGKGRFFPIEGLSSGEGEFDRGLFVPDVRLSVFVVKDGLGSCGSRGLEDSCAGGVLAFCTGLVGHCEIDGSGGEMDFGETVVVASLFCKLLFFFVSDSTLLVSFFFSLSNLKQ